MEWRNAQQPAATSVYVRRQGFCLLSGRNDTTDVQLRIGASNPDTGRRLLSQPYLPSRRAVDNHRTSSSPCFPSPCPLIPSSGSDVYPPTTSSHDNTPDQAPLFKRFSSFYDDDDDAQTVDYHRTMHQILDSLKSEMTLDGLVGAVVLSDGADDTSALVEFESQRHTVPAGEEQQSMPSISPTPMSELASASSAPVQPDNSIALSLNSSSRIS